MEVVMKRISIVTACLFALTLIAPAMVTSAAAQPQAPAALTIPVLGTGPAGTFTGTFQLQRFVTRDGTLMASGLLTGTVAPATGATRSVVRTLLLPAQITQATCAILHLDLGPLSLDLLGLQINLSQIVLDITAETGAGRLLGNLLCAIAGLLDNPAGLTRVLNDLLAVLG
jgi:hypothetical protein